MAQFIEGRQVRVKPTHPLIKYRGDVGTIKSFDSTQGYLVSLEENGSKFIQFIHLEDSGALTQKK